MIPDYYKDLKPVMKELVEAIGLNLILPVNNIWTATALGMHQVDGAVWVRMNNDDYWGGPNVILLHEIGHWTGDPERLARPEITDYRGFGYPPREITDHEEAVAQYIMMLLAPALGILTEEEARALFYKYVTWAYDVTRVTESAYQAVGYIKMLAPQVLMQKPLVRQLEALEPIWEAA